MVFEKRGRFLPKSDFMRRIFILIKKSLFERGQKWSKGSFFWIKFWIKFWVTFRCDFLSKIGGVKKDGRRFLVFFWCFFVHIFCTRVFIYVSHSPNKFCEFFCTLFAHFLERNLVKRQHVSYRNIDCDLVTLCGSDSDTKAATTY